MGLKYKQVYSDDIFLVLILSTHQVDKNSWVQLAVTAKNQDDTEGFINLGASFMDHLDALGAWSGLTGMVHIWDMLIEILFTRSKEKRPSPNRIILRWVEHLLPLPRLYFQLVCVNSWRGNIVSIPSGQRCSFIFFDCPKDDRSWQ